MAKGDSVRVVTRTTDETIVASQNGRTVELDFDKEGGLQWVQVKELTRGGSTVQRALFLVSEVVSVTRRAKGE